MSDRPPFIASQRLLLLDAGVADPHSYLSPALFRAGGNGGEAEGKGGGRPGHTAEPWQPVARDNLFFDPAIRRLCLTTDAGVGKTTTLKWAEQAAGQQADAPFALYLELRQLPAARRLYLEPGPEGTRPVLVEALLDGCDVEPSARTSPTRQQGGSALARRAGVAGQRLDDAAGQRILRHLLDSGRLLLLIDAIDQTLAEEHVGRKLQELHKFLQGEARACRAVVAGRPYAVHRYWNCLFHEGPWRFAQVAPFDADQQRAYLGPERHAHLERLDVAVLAIPRALETIRRLPVDQLGALHTAGDVYWRATDAMLEKAFDSAEVRREGFTVDAARWLLAVLAYEMARAGNFAQVAPDEMAAFRQLVWQRHGRHSDWASQAEFNEQLRLLGKLNDFMDYAVSDTSQLRDIHWKNRSLQEFFAGLWLSYYATDDDRPWLEQSVPRPDDEATERLEWVWRFAAEMPAPGRSPLRWVRSLAPAYRPNNDPSPTRQRGTRKRGRHVTPRRATELLYRSWDTMQAYAAQDSPAGALARTTLAAYQTEFREQILSGQRGPGPQRIAQGLLDEFRPIPPDFPPGGRGLPFRMGSPLTEPERYNDEGPYDAVVDGPFELACFQVTNEQYELFDPTHRERRSEYSPADRGPVVYVSWYDAWAFCRWLGPEYRLPSEKEWEFACRAGTTTAFHYGDSLSSKQANFDGNYPYGKAKKGPYLGRTCPVGSYQPNAWDLFDMHGNVWEWCDTWFDEDLATSDKPSFLGSARVLRGGSWLNFAVNARSAYRFHNHPAVSDSDVGFRVARALVRKS